MSNIIVTLTGPSGSGKTTLEKMLKTQQGFKPLISITTRPMREGEINGVNYHFVSKSEFKRLEEQEALVEAVEYNGHNYGMSKSEVAKFNNIEEQPGVFVCEPHGKDQIEAYAEKVGIKILRVFVDVNPQEQMERLLDRFSDEVDAAHYNKTKPYKEVLKTFASRMVAVMTTEQSWVANAHFRVVGNLINYDLIIPAFNESTQSQVINTICNIVDSETSKQLAEVG